MSEETVKPSVVVLASILLSLVINSTCGFTMIIVVVFCIGNFNKHITSSPGLLEFPHIYNFKQVINSTAGATVNERITVPVWAIPATTTISVLLSPINARSPIAFITAASLLISCLYASYLIAAILLLHCRTTKGFILILSLDLLALANTTGTKLIEGLFYLLGASYIANNIFSIYYLTVISFFNF
ncbi:CMGC/CLK protein kinase [Fusarium oxysporum f. sp. albedinis]|nr:CMGC/CLK protein kinase [Fusarium oxysporum f. sp. albedinis]